MAVSLAGSLVGREAPALSMTFRARRNLCTVCAAERVRDDGRGGLTRRAALATFLLLVGSGTGGAASAIGLKDLASPLLRDSNMDVTTAIVKVLDARMTLAVLQKLAATPADSKERFNSRAYLPGYAKRMRELGDAVPAVVRLVYGNQDSVNFSERYGGSAEKAPPLGEEALLAVGRVLTISGRTIKQEAQETPDLVREAGAKLDALIAQVPPEALERAQEVRRARLEKAAAK